MHISDAQLLVNLESDLLAAGWSGSEEPFPGQSVSDFAMTSLRRSLVKKYLPGTRPKNAEGDAAAVDLFLEVNESCRTYALDESQLSTAEAEVVGEVRKFLYDFFYPKPTLCYYCSVPDREVRSYIISECDSVLSLSNICLEIGPGPGATIGASSTDFFSKLALSRLSATRPDLHLLYRQAISYHPTWNRTEYVRHERQMDEVVRGSHLTCVPKTRKISRCIATEPLLNMFFQQGVRGAIERRLRQVVGIDLSRQPLENASLCRIGSITGRFGTIDLSSASDMLSINLMKSLLPRAIFDRLCMFRCHETRLPSGSWQQLHMISSMGNAFTFPLETLIFTAIVHACYEVLGIKPRHSRYRPERLSNFAVFGDDIIVLSRAYRFVTRMLTVFGFRVNMDKSFNEGSFRESCGHDYFDGRFVRGVYLEKLRDDGDLFSAINRLNRWSAHNSVPLPALVGFLSSKLRKSQLLVPNDESDDAGIKLPLQMARHYILIEGPSRFTYRALRLKRTVFKPSNPTREWKRKLNWFPNQDGLLLTLLSGNIRKGLITLRASEQRRKTYLERCTSPRWDWRLLDTWETTYSAEEWKLFCTLNLGERFRAF